MAIWRVGGRAKVNVMLFCARFSSRRLVHVAKASDSMISIMLFDMSRSSLEKKTVALVLYIAIYSEKIIIYLTVSALAY